MAADRDLELDALYRETPGDFIEARNAAAKRVRPEDRDLADELKALRKPSQAAWVLNQLALDEDDTLSEVLRTGLALKTSVQEGRGPSEQEAVRRARTGAISASAAAGLERLRMANVAPATATKHRLRKSLEALAAYGEALPPSPPGRMDADLEPPGFEFLAGIELASPIRKPTARPKAAKPRPKSVKAPTPTARSHSQSPPKLARRDLGAARNTAEQTEAAVAAAQGECKAVSDELRGLRARLEQASPRVATARRDLDSASRVRDRTRSELARLEKKAGSRDL
ncbi:MAG: hypothetical protein VYE73_04005 [Acidobacteriota bacterium]|nr:hypothetical protein [Acidobacteriota bacterium]